MLECFLKELNSFKTCNVTETRQMEPCPQFGGIDLAIDIYPWPTHHDYKGTKSWSTFTDLFKCAGVLGKE